LQVIKTLAARTHIQRNANVLGSSSANVCSALQLRERGTAFLRATVNTGTFKKKLKTFLFGKLFF